jgi:PKD repeat protein
MRRMTFILVGVLLLVLMTLPSGISQVLGEISVNQTAANQTEESSLVAAFDFSVCPLGSLATHITIKFTNLSTGGTGRYAYNWDFGDGGTSRSKNPTHYYASVGNYTVTLTVTDRARNVSSESQVVEVDLTLDATIKPDGGMLVLPVINLSLLSLPPINPPHLEVAKSVSPNVTCGAANVTLTVTGAGESTGERLPVDVIVIIDRSGSMSRNGKLSAAKTAAKDFIDLLDPLQDHVGLVSYSDSATLGHALTTDFNAVKSAINGLTATGFTNIADAIAVANQEFADHGRSPGVVWVEILLTDGLPNRWGHSPVQGTAADFSETAAQYARDAAQGARSAGIILYTIGLGNSPDISYYFLDDLDASEHDYNSGDPAGSPYNHNGLAFVGGGDYYHAPTPSDLEFMFEQISEQLSSIAATDIVVTEVLPAGVNYDDNANRVPYSVLGQTLTWHLGTINIGDTKTITFDVTFDNPDYQLVDVYPDTRVDYTNYLGAPASPKAFPPTHIRVLQPVADAGHDVTIGSGQSPDLDGSGSDVLGDCGCAGGYKEYQWSIKDGAVIQSWSAVPTVTVSPSANTTYTLEVRCSALPCCVDSDDVAVTVTECVPINLTVPDDITVGPCPEDVSTAFADWLAQAHFTGGCNAEMSTDPETPVAPPYCGGNVTVTWTVTGDCDCDGPVSANATFTVLAAPKVDLTVPDDMTVGLCPEDLSTAFADWLAQARFTGGCNAEMSSDPETPVAPPYCGGNVTVTWTVTGDCQEPVSDNATFTVLAALKVDLTVPDDMTVGPCPEDLSTAFADWLAQARFTGGCNAEMSSDPETPVAPPHCGGNVTITWTVTGDCQEPVSDNATFTVTAPHPVDLTVPDDLTVGPNPANLDTTFANWLAEASFAGGCGASMTTHPENPQPPAVSGGAITVTWTVTSNCEEPVSATATFTVVPPPPQPPAGGGGCPCRCGSLTVDWEGSYTTKPLYTNDKLAVDLLGPSPDLASSLFLERATHAPVVGGTTYYLITITHLDQYPALPQNTEAIVVYNVTPTGAVFDKDLLLTLGLTDAQLPAAGNVTMDYYDDVNHIWVPLNFEAGGGNGVAALTLSAPITHFSIYGVLAQAPDAPVQPAHFVSSGLNIETGVQKIWAPVTFVTRTGQSVTITANVFNDGYQQGTFTAALKLNGQTVDTKTITLAAGKSTQVKFTESGLAYGQYEVEVAGLTGQFTTSRIITWWLIAVIVVGIGLIIWGIVWGRRRRRAH